MIRLAVANWLAYYELPPDRRPPPDPNVSGRFAFYAFGPEAPAGARALSPAALDRWLKTTTDAQDCSVAGSCNSGRSACGSGPTTGHWWSSWRASFIAATTVMIRRPTRRWSGPISRACPMTAWGKRGTSAPKCARHPEPGDRPSRSDDDDTDIEREP